MMYADIDRDLVSQAEDIRRHVRKLLLNLVVSEKRKASERGKSAPVALRAEKIPVSNPMPAASLFPEILEALPAAVYVTDAVGFITYYNEAAVALWGRRPVLGQDRWCGSWRIYRPDGTALPHEDCPMAIALRENKEVRNVDAIAERPDGTWVHFMPFATPLRDASDTLIGAVNVLIDIGALQVAAPTPTVPRST
ncbi:PAS domain-containing protein [Microvirga sp. 2TAF3]|uniref:PAS domain-containing protein n=1 Tax=Microvirga sp. 2TAF3 TaxID=3233014 RepID=UPI003F995A16